MARTAQISKEKQQSIITLRHEGQSILKNPRTLNVSSNSVAKIIKSYDETGSHEEWTLVLWSDESKFEVFGSNCREMQSR